MSGTPSVLRRHGRKLLVALLALVVLVVGVPFVYINFIREDAREKRTVEDVTDCSTASTGSAAAAAPIDGSWTIGAGSSAGYRIGETLAGQRATAEGRTSNVSGTLTAAGTTISAVSATVDMASVTSPEPMRDGQFRGRIMSTSQFKTATFVLTSPIELAGIPGECEKVSATATGDLTLRGQTRSVTTTVNAVRQGATFAVDATFRVSLDDFQIPEAAGGRAAAVDREGDIELVLVFSKA